MSRDLALPTLVCALSVVLACGKSAPGTAAAASEHPKSAAQVNTGNACDRKLLTAADAAGILSEPVTGTKPIPGDPQSCEFTTGSYSSVEVTLRPGLGRTTLGVWKSGRMPVSGTTLTGVGDEAVWVASLTEVIAEKNDLLCDIQVTGLAGVLQHKPPPASRRRSARCATKSSWRHDEHRIDILSSLHPSRSPSAHSRRGADQ